MDTKSIFDSVFNSTEKEDFKNAIKEVLINHLKDDLESFAETAYCFNTSSLINLINEAINEAKEEVKEELKQLIRERMMKALDLI